MAAIAGPDLLFVEAGFAPGVSAGQHWIDIFLIKPFLVDGDLIHFINHTMVKFRPQSQRMQRAFLVSVVACLFLLQTLSFIFSPEGRLAFAKGNTGGSIVMAGDICRAAQNDGGKTPATPGSGHCHHCILCTSGAHDSTLNALALLVNVFVLLAPRSDVAPIWPRHAERALWPPGFASTWLSGVPPSVS
jgi:hypothetical protein